MHVPDEPANPIRPTAPGFGLEGRVAIVTGGSGVLGAAMVRGIAAAGARVAIVGRRAEACEVVAASVHALGGEALATPADVLDRATLEAVRSRIVATWGRVDLLVNAAGGNQTGATLRVDQSFFDLDPQAMRDVMDLNFHGAFLASQVFARPMVDQGAGAIVNVSSMAARAAVTRVSGYGAAKAALDNFTRWLATTLAHQTDGRVRVNAIAPGFFIAEQNRRLLLEEDGTLTPRGRTIVDRTPMGRFGEADDLVGALVWLLSDVSRFVTGAVVPIDGGFSAFSGV